MSLREIIIELLRRLNSIGVKRVSRTKIMKLLYLIDRECRELLNRTCTGTRWILWWHGPFSRSVLDVLDDLEIQGIVETDVTDYYDYTIIEYSLMNPNYTIKIDNQIRKIIYEVVKKWGKKELKEILAYVYSLPEVKHANLGDEL